MQIQRLRRVGIGTGTLALLALALTFVVVAFLNSNVVTRVSVTYVGDDEVRDVSLNAEERLPDYRIDLKSRQEKYTLGVSPNTSAADGITFHVAKPIPQRALQEIILLEDDPVKNDELARVQGQSPDLAAQGYQFSLAIERSFDGGLIWFFDTPIGKAIAWGLGVAVLIIVLAIFAPMLS